jgi:hypothetical protein
MHGTIWERTRGRPTFTKRKWEKKKVPYSSGGQATTKLKCQASGLVHGWLNPSILMKLHMYHAS